MAIEKYMWGLSETISESLGNLVSLVRIANAEAINAYKLRIHFDKPMKKNNSLSDVSNYTITPHSPGALTPYVYEVDLPDVLYPTYVDLITSKMTGELYYKIEVSTLGPVSYDDLHIDEYNNIRYFTSILERPTISQIIVISDIRIDIVFSENMKYNDSIKDISNYTFDNGLSAISILEVDGDTVKMVTTEQLPNVIYTLTINTESSFENISLVGTYSDGLILRSVDLGETWIQVEDTTEAHIASMDSFKNGIILAGTGTSGKIFRSIDYGQTWLEVEDTTEGYILCLATFPNGIALASTYGSGKIFRSIDYGETWLEVEDTTETRIWSLATHPNGIAIAGSYPNGKIFRSIDYGETWSEVEDTAEGIINSLVFFYNGVALASTGDNGKIYRSIDYGETWYEIEDTAEIRLVSMTIFMEGIVLTGSYDGGKIFRSDDFGQTWTEVLDTTETYIWSMVSSTNGMALFGTGENGKIYRTLDYGLTWSEVEDLTVARARSMSNVIRINLDSITDLSNNNILDGSVEQFIGYVEPETTPETLSLKMYNFLLYTIRQIDSTREGTFFVKRLFEGPQSVWQTTHDKIFSIKDLWSITKCPDEYLKYLKWIVGWTSELDYVTDELDFYTLRRLIASSIPLWRKRGQEETIIDIISLVANSRCRIWNWFDYRWITDETEFVEDHQGRDPWIVDIQGEPDFGEYYNTLRIVDNGDLDRTLVKNLVKFMKPCGERIEIAYIDFLDMFLVEDDTSQWETAVGEPMIVQDGYGILEDTSYQLSIVSFGDSLVWNRYVFYCRIKGIGTGNPYGLVFYYKDVDNYYELILNIDSITNDYVLNKIEDGASTNVTSGTIIQKILDDIWYGIRIHIDEESGSNRIKLYIDGSEIFNVLDSSTLEEGTIGFFNSASATTKLDECELFQLPLETELVDINS